MSVRRTSLVLATEIGKYNVHTAVLEATHMDYKMFWQLVKSNFSYIK